MSAPKRSRLVEVLITTEDKEEAYREQSAAVQRLKKTGMNTHLSVWCGQVAGVWQVWLLRK